MNAESIARKYGVVKVVFADIKAEMEDVISEYEEGFIEHSTFDIKMRQLLVLYAEAVNLQAERTRQRNDK